MQREAIKSFQQQVEFKHHWDEAKKNSHSQFFEDMILSFIFHILKTKNIFYIDIGAYDGITYSNTMMLYKLGARGINIEPMKTPYNTLCAIRKEDINLNIAINDKPGDFKFFKSQYDMCASLEEDYIKKFFSDLTTIDTTDIISVECITVHQLIDRYNLKQKDVDLLCIDTKGKDKMVIDGFIEERVLPKVICAETGNGFSKKNVTFQNWIQSKGYMLHSDTFINSIFVRQDLAKKYYTIK